MSRAKIKTIRDLLDITALEYGDRTFIKFLDGDDLVEKSYRTLRNNSYAISRYIRDLEPERMHIAIIGKTNYEYLTCLTGILISNNVAVPFAPDISVDEATGLFDRADIDMLFYEDNFEASAKELLQRCAKLKRIVNLGDRSHFNDIYSKYSDSSEFASLADVEIDPEACVTIMYTSGTTGDRKGVMLSSRNLISNIDYGELEFGKDDVVLSVLPMHHIFCYSGDFLKTVNDGVTVCLNGDISQIGKSFQVFQPTIMRTVPMIATTLLKKVQSVERRNPDLGPHQAAQSVFGKRFKWLICAGAYLSPAMIDEYSRYGIMLRQGYGMTETSPRIAISVFDDYRADSCGRVLKICDVRIQDGEVQVKSPSVMMGYYKQPEETAKIFTEDGYLKTGDLGSLTSDNYIYITGRLKNLIILSNGENVSPEEIEKKFIDEPLIKEIVVYGENDLITAEIFPDYQYAECSDINNLEDTLWELVDKVNETSDTYRQISSLKIREVPFPKTASGKIKRTAVKF